MVLHHYVPKCWAQSANWLTNHARKFVCWHEVQGHCEGLYMVHKQIWLSTTFIELLIFLQPNLIWWYIIISWSHHHHHHLSLNCKGHWGTRDDFTTSLLHFSLFTTASWDLANSRPAHSLMLSSQLFLCLPCLPPPFIVLCKMVFAKPDESWSVSCKNWIVVFKVKVTVKVQSFIESLYCLLYHLSLGNRTRCADLLLLITKPSTTKWAYSDLYTGSSTLTYTVKIGGEGGGYFAAHGEKLFFPFSELPVSSTCVKYKETVDVYFSGYTHIFLHLLFSQATQFISDANNLYFSGDWGGREPEWRVNHPCTACACLCKVKYNNNSLKVDCWCSEKRPKQFEITFRPLLGTFSSHSLKSVSWFMQDANNLDLSAEWGHICKARLCMTLHKCHHWVCLERIIQSRWLYFESVLYFRHLRHKKCAQFSSPPPPFP